MHSGYTKRDKTGYKLFEVHQHGEVLLYFRSPRFTPRRGGRQLGRLPPYLRLPRPICSHADPRLRGQGGSDPAPSHPAASPAQLYLAPRLLSCLLPRGLKAGVGVQLEDLTSQSCLGVWVTLEPRDWPDDFLW
nr:uncharacterized protein LOC102903654 [Peromyscus maniculatus bairdii]